MVLTTQTQAEFLMLLGGTRSMLNEQLMANISKIEVNLRLLRAIRIKLMACYNKHKRIK